MRKYVSIGALVGFSIFSSLSFSEEIQGHIDIFTTTSSVQKYNISRLKMLTKMPVNIHYVDAIGNFSDYLGGETNFSHRPTKADIKKVQTATQKKLNSPSGKREKEKLQEGIKSFQKAKRLGLTRIPAVVFEDKFIVYGERPIKALKIYRLRTGAKS